MRTKRIDLIEEFILSEHSVSLDTLCEKFKVSKNTVRRDIDELVQKGTIKKVYGGVVSNGPEASQGLLPYEQRNTSLPEEKDAISRLAASFVKDGDIIFIDTGTTCLPMVDHLHDRTCTILTNSLQVCVKAIPYATLQVITLPGTLKRETLSFVGNDIGEYLKTFNIQKAFMASTGVSIENGLTNASMEEYYVKKAVIQNSSTRFLLSDRTKFGRFSLMTYCNLTDVQHIITDQRPPAEYEDFCQENTIALHIAK
ncbi:MAG: DeoR/GlpR family DNA-binding transcription regulator [Eubacteriales bacterium]|nr:DeoR/GlpR family DNA-binding transcription regulator [Eubacteriales bacterium]